MVDLADQAIVELAGTSGREAQLEANPPNIAFDDPIYQRNAEIARKQYANPIPLMKRPDRGNTSGTSVVVRINAFKIIDFPTKVIWQYDVSTTFFAMVQLTN